MPIATRLLTAFPVTGYDHTDKKRAAAVDAGITVTETPAAAARDAGIVVIAVRTLAQAEECLFGANGAVSTLSPGTAVMLMSTIGSEGARLLGGRLAALELEFVDAPMSGSAERAAAGDLLVLVGASESALERARPALELLARKLVVVGPHPGDGQAMKTVNQLLCGVHIAAAAEALVLAAALGLDLTATLDALQAGAADSFMLRTRGPRIIDALKGNETAFASRLDLFVKDMAVVVSEADRADLHLAVAQAAGRLFQEAERAGLGATDDSAVSLVLSSSSR
jgi:3-hydroxyisobutyrate dehydrogenase